MFYNGAVRGSGDECMDTSDTPWSWYYLANCGRWHRFEDDPDNPLVSEDIERHYLRNVQMFSSTGASMLDFSAMIQTNLDTGMQRRIQRSHKIEIIRCCCFSSAPIFWEMVDPKLPYQLIPLNDVTPEFQTVASFVKNEGMLNGNIESIYRIQNLDLWELYCRKKRQLIRIRDVRDISERRLFHGTQASNVDAICTYNFDYRLAGIHGHVYGKGAYFARDATYADKFSRSSTQSLPVYGGVSQQSQQTKIIFLARVIVGNSKMGQRDFLKPDHESTTNSHDSCVDDVNHPKIFVIFDPNQIYPEYLIQYC